MKSQPASRKTISMVDRLGAPTTLIYELGCIVYATAAGSLILLTLSALHRR